ncbi:tryptophan-rich sensory protein [Sinomonas atrocyanea]
MHQHHHTARGAQPRPLAAAVATAASAVAALILAAWGSGAFGGTTVQDAASGYLSATATPVAPAAAAFSIWSLIYLGLLAYAVWQFLPGTLASERQRALRPWAAASMLLNAAWLWAAQLGSPSVALPVSLAVMLALLAVLCRMLVLHLGTQASSFLETVVSDGTFGLYLGWICVATVANAAALVAALLGIAPGAAQPALPGGISAAAVAVVVLAVAAAVGVALALRGRISPCSPSRGASPGSPWDVSPDRPRCPWWASPRRSRPPSSSPWRSPRV